MANNRSYISRMKTPKDSEIRRLIHNQNKRISRIKEKWGTRSGPYEANKVYINSNVNLSKILTNLDSNEYKLSTDIEKFTVEQKKNLYLDLRRIKSISDFKFETQEFLAEQSNYDYIVEEVGITEDINADNLRVIEEVIQIKEDIVDFIDEYRSKGYTADDLGAGDLHKSHKSYEELRRIARDGFLAMKRKEVERDRLKNEGQRLKEEALRDYYKNKG